MRITKKRTLLTGTKCLTAIDRELAGAIVRLNMARKPKDVIELRVSDLFKMSVPELDSELTSVWSYIAAAIGVRVYKAANEKIEAPLPAPPNILLEMFGGNVREHSSLQGTANVRVNQARRLPNTMPTKPPKHVTWISGSATHTAYSIIDRFPRGVDLPIFREEFLKLTNGDTEGAHSKALQTLRNSGHIVTYKKRVFSFDRLKQFLEDVRAGVADDVADEQPTLRGKWAVAVYECIRGYGGAWVDFRAIVEDIVRLPGFENAANAPSQVAVALRNLQYRHNSIEKMKGRGKSQYRIKLEDEPRAVAEASAATH